MKRRAKTSTSAVVLTKNSAATLPRCLSSLKFCDEIVVVDDYSTDTTIKVARTHGARIFRRHLSGDFAAQRNFGLAKAKGEWVLFLDSDEELTDHLPTQSGRSPVTGHYDGYYIKRRDFWLGREIKHGETNIKLLRLAKKGLDQWVRRVHEYWDVRGQVGSLDAEIKHYPHPSLRDFIAEINSYSQIHADEIKKEGKSPSLSAAVFFPILKFLQNFIIKGGFADGVHGFVIAGIMSFHSFLAWSQLWLNSRGKKY